MKISKAYITRLEEVSKNDSISAILDAKLLATSPTRTVDYIAFAIDNLQNKERDIAAAQKSLQELKHEVGSTIEHIKEECADWLSSAGLDKLDGLIVSSMSINEPKPKEELIVLNEEALINQGYFKTVLDKTAVKKALQEGEELEGAKLEIIHVANKIRINKKR